MTQDTYFEPYRRTGDGATESGFFLLRLVGFWKQKGRACCLDCIFRGIMKGRSGLVACLFHSILFTVHALHYGGREHNRRIQAGIRWSFYEFLYLYLCHDTQEVSMMKSYGRGRAVEAKGLATGYYSTYLRGVAMTGSLATICLMGKASISTQLNVSVCCARHGEFGTAWSIIEFQGV